MQASDLIPKNKLPLDQVEGKLKELGLLVNDKPISYTKFKKEYADVHCYTGRLWGKRVKQYVIYVGTRENKFGFYPPLAPKEESLKMAYQYYLDTATSDFKMDFTSGLVMWGNCGIPLTSRPLRCDL